jgi:predicted signal transduction protein with EAL and GGDEF domain
VGEVFAFASIGIASSDLAARTTDDLLRNADIAMYRAKRSGSRTALVYEASMHTETMDALELGSDLYHAVARGQLRLQFQPVVNLITGSAVAVEALVRWDHPDRGVVPPTVFIPIAERTGVIIEIARQLDEPSFPDLADAVPAFFAGSTMAPPAPDPALVTHLSGS